MLSQPKVSIIGAGNVGAEIAYALVLLQIGVEVVLYNRTLDKAEGAAWDIEDAIPLVAEMKVAPTDRYEDLAGSDLVVITVGASRPGGEERLALLDRNAEIMASTIAELDRVAPEAKIIVVSNPVDVLTRIAIETSIRPEQFIFGSGTVLDTARLVYQLGKQLQISQQDIHVYVLGEHGNSEFITWSSATIGSVPLQQFGLVGTSIETMQNYVQQTRQRGYDISQRKGYTSCGVATAVAQLVKAVLRDEKKVFTVSVRAASAYGIGSEVVLGLPCIIGREGIERQLILPRDEAEQKSLVASATKLKQAYDSYHKSSDVLKPQ